MSSATYQRRCHDCGSTSRETPFPGTRKPHKQFDRCCDCVAELERPFGALIVTQAQLDLVDLLVAPP